MTILTGFTINKPSTGKFVDIDMEINQNINTYQMRPNQKEVFKYKDEQYFILSEPPGSGKSTSIRFVVNNLLQENPNLKAIIAVPQTLIAKTFSKVLLKYSDGSQCEWDISRNLCDSISRGRKSLNLRNFLLKKRFGNDLSDRIALVTHITLSKLSTKIDFDNVIVIIDEGHHVLYPENGKTETANKIGKIVGHLISQNNPTVKVWFVTATFYRGDKSPIIPQEEAEKFTKYYLPLDEYWEKYIKHIHTFSYNFVIYKDNDVFSGIKEIIRQNGKKKTIIYCPYNGNLVRGTDKLGFRDKIIETIKEVWDDCKILDLVEVENRLGRKQIIIDNVVDFDIVLAVKLFDEGTDWPDAERSNDLNPSDSLRLIMQRFGRLLRDIPGKSHISYYVFLPYQAKFKNGDDRRLHLSKSLNALIASAILHDAIEPIPYPSSELKPGTGKEKSKKNSSIDPFAKEVPDETKRQDVLNSVIRDLVFLKNLKEEPNREDTKECIIKTLKDFGIKDVERVAVHVAKILRRTVAPRNPKWELQTIDVSWMVESGFDKVWSDDVYTGILSFTTGTCGVDTFKEFRDVYNDSKTPSEWVTIAEQLAEKNGGLLPPTRDIPSGLCNCIRRHSDLFTHIKRNDSRVFYKNYTVDDWIIVAKELEKIHGHIPKDWWLSRRKMRGLIRSLKEHPEKFNHIKRETSTRRLDEWIIIAKEVLDEYGYIPSQRVLENQGMKGLRNSLRVNPDVFSHLDIKYKGGRKPHQNKTTDEWLVIAEELEKKYFAIPSRTWLFENGYCGLYVKMYKNKDLFSKFKQTSERLESKKKWIKVARAFDIIPCYSYLRDNKLGGLISAIRKYPDWFKGMKKYKNKYKNIIVTIGEDHAT